MEVEERQKLGMQSARVEATMHTWVKGYELNLMNSWYVPFHKITKEE